MDQLEARLQKAALLHDIGKVYGGRRSIFKALL